MIFFGGEFLSDLYHPRALFEMFELVQQRIAAARLKLALSSACGWPYTTPDAWPFHDQFNDSADSLLAWPPGELLPVQIRLPPFGTLRSRRLAWDDCA